MDEAKSDQPQGDVATTFTHNNVVFGVDGAGKIWKRTAAGWEDTGAQLPGG